MSNRKPREPNLDMPSTAISFEKADLELLRRMAAVDDRSVASLVRKAVEFYLRSAEGRELARRTVARERDLSLKTNLAAAIADAEAES